MHTATQDAPTHSPTAGRSAAGRPRKSGGVLPPVSYRPQSLAALRAFRAAGGSQWLHKQIAQLLSPTMAPHHNQ